MTTITIPTDKTEKIEADIAVIQKHVAEMKITTKPEYEAGAELLAKLKSRKDRVKELENELLGDIETSLKTAKNKFKMLAQPYIDAEATVRLLLNQYVNEQMRIAQEQAEKLHKQQEAERKIAEKKGEPIPTPMVAVAAPNLKVQTEAGGIHTRTVKKWKLTAKTKVPAQYWILDEVAINTQMRAGNEIPGIEYYEEQVVAVR